MKLFHTISTNTFEAISYKENYLYLQYERLQSFLSQNIFQEFDVILAKPVLENNQVNWYCSLNSDLKRITEFDETTKNELLQKYWKLISSIKDKIQELELSSENDKKEWASFLNEVFNDDNNIIFSDGTNLVLLWGWKFRNSLENEKKAALVMSSIPAIVEQETSHEYHQTESFNQYDENTTEYENLASDKKLTLWQRIKAFFKKYWWILLLLLIIILLLLLLKKCNKKEVVPPNCCTEIDSLFHVIDSMKNEISELRDNQYLSDGRNNDIDYRREREGGKVGEITATLMWNSYDDLDLIVKEPNGNEIFFKKKKSSTGGELDVDMNAGRENDPNPIENIRWLNNVPKGDYQVKVLYYGKKSNGNEAIPYLVELHIGKKTLKFKGSHSNEKDIHLVHRFTYTGEN